MNRICACVGVLSLALASGCATPLGKAAGDGDAEQVRKLSASGADLEGVNDPIDRFTPLMYAASYGHLGAARALLDAGADPFAVSGSGETAYQVALERHFPAVARFLSDYASKPGIAVASRSGRIVVAQVVAQSPAQLAGIETDDLLLAIDGASVEGLDARQVRAKLHRASSLTVQSSADAAPRVAVFQAVSPQASNAARVQAALAQARKMAGLPPRPEPAAGTAEVIAPPRALAPAGFSSEIDAPSEHSLERPDDFALVIGVEDYQTLPKADYGVRDAEAVRKHLAALGVPERNIVALEGSSATGGKLKSYLQQWLPRNVRPDSTVYVYYSGHGAPDPASGDAYLVPWDGDPMFLASTAYPLKQFYADLAKLPAQRIVVALDACFSGAGGRSVLAKGARPLVTKIDASAPAAGNLVVFAAAGGEEITGTLDAQGHGLFTYYFLKGLSGGAQNASGAVTPKSLFDYLKPRVQDEARRQNREQTPSLSGGGGDAPLARY